MGCFDASGFYCLAQGVLRDYRDWWDTFERIQAYNSNVSTSKAAGATGLTYYKYIDYTEQTAFQNGRMLHIRRYPDSNWDPVEKN